MDLNSPVVQLCVEGTRAEYAGNLKDARALYWQAWNTAKDDFEACIAAHYVARFQENPEDILFWNQEALDRANVVKNDLVKDFYPSLYLNMGHSHELLGNSSEAQTYYDLAAQLGYRHLEEENKQVRQE